MNRLPLRYGCKALRFRRRKPDKTEPLLFESQQRQHFLDYRQPRLCLLIAVLIMALAKMAAHHQNAVRTKLKASATMFGWTIPEHITRMILRLVGYWYARGAGKVGGGIRAPVAAESQNFRFESRVEIRQVLSSEKMVACTT